MEMATGHGMMPQSSVDSLVIQMDMVRFLYDSIACLLESNLP